MDFFTCMFIFLVSMLIVLTIEILKSKTLWAQIAWNYCFHHRTVYKYYKQFVNSGIQIPVFSLYRNKNNDWNFVTHKAEKIYHDLPANEPYLMRFGNLDLFLIRLPNGTYIDVFEYSDTNLMLQEVLNTNELIHYE